MIARKTLKGSLIVLATLVASNLLVRGTAEATGDSRAFLNGELVRVHFNDGDSFRIHTGGYRGTQCRLAGFNTLESFGPAHQWGDWHPYELYINAKMATYNGRRGTWHCTTEGELDVYGRLLVDCPDLVVDQISRGYAHAMNVDDAPSRPEYLRAQQEAIRERRGMWAHGVPDFIMTSLHSADEDPGRDNHYNRLVSTRDGHSERMIHNDVYSECSWTCSTEIRVDRPAIVSAARRLRADPQIGRALGDYSNTHLIEFASRYRRLGELPEYLEGPARSLVERRLAADLAQGLLGQTRTVRGSCGIYVEFHRRYGRNIADCLRGHGDWQGAP